VTGSFAIIFVFLRIRADPAFTPRAFVVSVIVVWQTAEK
jgi:hypothetical protein